MTNKLKGDIYEEYVKNYLVNKSNSYVWLWNDIPEVHLRKMGYIGDWNKHRIIKREDKINNFPDVGCDILQLQNNEYIIVQCKNYNSKNVTLTDLGTFYYFVFNYNKRGVVYYSKGISRHITEHKPNNLIEYIKLPMVQTTTQIISTKLLERPYYYQVDAYNALKGKQRTMLSLCCGMGKTLIGIMLGKDYKQIIILSPLRAHAKQNLNRFQDELQNYNGLLISSDTKGTRDENKIKKFIKENPNIILSFTYDSCDLLMKIKSTLNNFIVIFDEFHNLSYNDVFKDEISDDESIDEISDNEMLDDESVGEILDDEMSDDESVGEILDDEISDDESIDDTFDDDSVDDTFDDDESVSDDDSTETVIDNPIYDLLHSDARIVFLSATPKIFDNEEIFGKIDYNFDMGKAIKENYICDYQVFLPSLTNKKLNIDIKNIFKDLKYDEEMILQAMFILRGSYEIGNKKCIVYLSSIDECKQFNTVLRKLNKDYFYDEPIFSEIIVADTKDKQRIEHLENFSKFTGKAFLLSVRILDECIDIVKCDSIFITKSSNNKIRNIQRVCRANRKDPCNPNKIASIYLWCSNEFNSCVDIIRHLKEYDETFNVNKVKLFNSNSTTKDCEEKRTTNNEEYDILDKFIVGVKKLDTWNEMLEKVKLYIDTHKKRPSDNDKNIEVKQIGKWLYYQQQLYKNNKYNNEINIKFENFLSEYDEYVTSFKKRWYNNLKKLKEYINNYKEKPSINDKNKNIKQLAQWLYKQQEKYKINNNIMKNQEIKKVYEDFIQEYKIYFLSNNDIWISNLEKLTNYISIHKKLPLTTDINNEIKYLAYWLIRQKKCYITNTGSMTNKIIKIKYEEFLQKHKTYFISNKDIWFSKLDILKNYIDINHKLPSRSNIDVNIKQIRQWFDDQNKSYTKNKNIMKNQDIRKAFEDFLQEYKIKD